jgi:hypothetical protein
MIDILNPTATGANHQNARNFFLGPVYTAYLNMLELP